MQQIKQLREKTGAGIVDCKQAIEEASGDIEKAVEILRKKGIAKAAKRSSRKTNEGIIKVAISEAGTEGYIVEVNTETDFVARNEQFQQFTEKILNIIKDKKPKNKEELMKLKMENETVQENLENLSGVIGEKLDIKRCDVIASTGTVAAYSHMGGKIGVLISLDGTGENELAYNIAMQIAAANPKYIIPEDAPDEEIEKEKKIYREQLKKEGKQEEIIEKILQGKINKYLEEVCLVKQEYIKDDKKRVGDILGDVKVKGFIRYNL
ncbi:elongation factor Ts [Candidatus Parcubacteria bacterium]|nr:elongation factor Ts [Candidatus Parcubacteria bacterium]